MAKRNPNHVWTVDFKGWFILGNQQRCDPLTVCDRCHYVLACDARPNQQFKGTLHAFRGLMRHHGLPEIIRCDPGSPFASNGLGRLSSLSLWWIEQGIEVEFIRPGSPQDNGSHERMHRDLKAEATQPVSPNFTAQQRRFDRWQHTYNYERPHEALDQRPPAEFYRPSARRLGENDKPLVYPAHQQVRVVSDSGHVAHEGRNYYVGDAFAGKRRSERPAAPHSRTANNAGAAPSRALTHQLRLKPHHVASRLACFRRRQTLLVFRASRLASVTCPGAHSRQHRQSRHCRSHRFEPMSPLHAASVSYASPAASVKPAARA